MTLTAATTRNDYTATSGQTVFPYTFTALSDTDIKVVKNGVTLTLGGGNDYTVSGIGSYGGNVTLNVGATTGDTLSVYLDMPIDRTTNYQNSGDFLAVDVNGDVNKSYIAMQQLATKLSQGVRKPVADVGSIDMELPDAATRANKMLAFDSSGAVVAETYLSNENLFLTVDAFTGNGSTTAFTLSASNASPSYLQVLVNGLMQAVSSYSIDGAVLTFSEAPPSSALIEVRQFVNRRIVSTEFLVNNFQGNGSTTAFTLSSPAVTNNVMVHINGIYQYKSTYSVSGTTLTFSEAPPINSDIETVNQSAGLV
jgi:hypothetical protein